MDKIISARYSSVQSKPLLPHLKRDSPDRSPGQTSSQEDDLCDKWLLSSDGLWVM